MRRPWRRRGLARALVMRSLAVLRDRGLTSAGLGVDADNANEALRLYTECGFERGDEVDRLPQADGARRMTVELALAPVDSRACASAACSAPPTTR